MLQADSPISFLLATLNLLFFILIIYEFFFRGSLQTWLKDKIGAQKAIILTSLIFAAFCLLGSHIEGVSNIEIFLYLFSLSYFSGFIYERQNSLLASISLHAFFNAVMVATMVIK